MALRLLPVIIADLIFAAHFIRFYGIYPALLIVLLLGTLLVRKNVVRIGWQIFLFIASLIWVQISFQLVQTRIVLEMPWTRLAIIMAAVTLFTLLTALWLETPRLKAYFKKASPE